MITILRIFSNPGAVIREKQTPAATVCARQGAPQRIRARPVVQPEPSSLSHAERENLIKKVLNMPPRGLLCGNRAVIVVRDDDLGRGPRVELQNQVPCTATVRCSQRHRRKIDRRRISTSLRIDRAIR